MSDLKKLLDQFANVVREQLKEHQNEAEEVEADCRIVSAILNKPIILLPQDIMKVFRVGKTTAYKMINDDRFPKPRKFGGQKYIEREDLMAALLKFDDD